MGDNLPGAIAALNRAIDACGGVGDFAQAINVKQSTVSMWRARGRIPSDHCPAIEAAARVRGAQVTCEELRPDVAWHVLRSNALN